MQWPIKHSRQLLIALEIDDNVATSGALAHTKGLLLGKAKADPV